VRPAKPVTFCLWLRNPSWSRATQIACPGAEARLVGGFWQVRKEWKSGDKVAIRFEQGIREVQAVNGEIALQYGPLLYVLPVPGTTKTVKTYPRAGFEDYLMSANKDVETKLALPAWNRAQGFGFTPRHASAIGADPDFPLDNPPMELEGKLVRESDGALVHVRLVPMGAQSARLRRVTFPVVNGEKN
jgi:cold shock CspA family protein